MGVLDFSTGKILVVHSYGLRILKLSIQLAVLAYLCWIMYYEKAYQKETIGFGFSQITVHGSAYSVQGNDTTLVWDNADVVFPAKEREALFLVSNYQSTRFQKRDVCAGSDNSTESCIDGQCPFLKPTLNGITTGVCNTSVGYCEIYAWCPLEANIQPPPTSSILQNVKDFNITLKNYANWPTLGISRNNLNGTTVGYNSFTVEQIIASTGYTYEEVAAAGAAIGVIINWNCDFDKNIEECQPKFEFLRLDNPESTLSVGFNFRYLNEYRTEDAGPLFRDLFKVYGLRFVFLTSVVGNKFNIVNTVLNFASAIGLLSIANYIADMICMWLLPNSPYYRNQKFVNVDEKEKEERRQEWNTILSPDELNKAYF